MRPAEFWDATPREVFDMNRGAAWRERRAWERTAWAAATIIAPHLGNRTPTIDRLLSFLGPEDGTKAAEPVSEEEAAELVKGLFRQHKKKFWTLYPDEFADDTDKEKKE